MISIIETLEQLTESYESVAVAPKPFDPNAPAIDPDTFMGMAGLSPIFSKRRMAKSPGFTDCGNGLEKIETIENTAPTRVYRFVGKIKNGADKDLAHGYHHTKFVSLLQKMIAPLPIINKPSGIEVEASPALEKGLIALAKKNGLKTFVLEHHCTEHKCHCTDKTEGHCS